MRVSVPSGMSSLFFKATRIQLWGSIHNLKIFFVVLGFELRVWSLPRLVLNCYPPDHCLLSSYDYWCEPLGNFLNATIYCINNSQQR
jgi:hypothetical protein